MKQRPTQKSAQKWQLQPFATSCTKDYEGHSSMQTSFAELPSSAVAFTAIFARCVSDICAVLLLSVTVIKRANYSTVAFTTTFARCVSACTHLLPFVVCGCSEKSKRRTKTIASTTDPTWNQTFIYCPVKEVDLRERLLEITAWDYDRIGASEFLGEVSAHRQAVCCLRVCWGCWCSPAGCLLPESLLGRLVFTGRLFAA